MNDDFSFANFPLEFETSSSHIKVIGVGGGGCNVVAEIAQTNPKDVDLVICNTDEQALNDNPVNYKIKLGSQKLGAGLDPSKGRAAAKSSEKEIENIFDGETEMVFVTACLGGGTGTGAAPVIAEIAKRMGKLVIGVVTKPFRDEGLEFMERANEGLRELRKHVDSTIIIDNQKIYEPYGNLSIHDAYSKVNQVLVTAVTGVSKIVTISGKINVDMNDVRKVMSNSGTATIGTGSATIQEGVSQAVDNALTSPLLNDCNFQSSKGALVVLMCDERKAPMTARQQVAEHIQKFAGNPKNFKLGLYTGSEYGDRIFVTVVITGFKLENTEILGDEHVIIGTNGEIIEMDNIAGGTILKAGPQIEEQYIRRRTGEKPVLIVEEESELLQLEEEPAFERKNRRRKEKLASADSGFSSSVFTIKEIGTENVFSTNNSYLHKTQD